MRKKSLQKSQKGDWQGLGNPLAVMAAGQSFSRAGKAAGGFLMDENGNIKWVNLGLLGIGAFVIYKYTPVGNIFKATGKVADAVGDTFDSAGNLVKTTVDGAGNIIKVTLDKTGNIVGNTVDVVGSPIKFASAGLKRLYDFAFTDNDFNKARKEAATHDLRLKYAFNPNYFKIVSNAKYSTTSEKKRLEQLAKDVYDSKGYFNDDEDKIGSVFSSMNSLAECSALTYYFNEKNKKDIFTFIDFLDDREFYIHVWSKLEKLPLFI